MAHPREITNKIYDAVDQGLLTSEEVMIACLKYMSEDSVADMAHYNEFYLGDEDEGDEDEGDEDSDQ